jgi:hypothetical protein
VLVVLRVIVPIVGAPGTMFVTTTSDGADASPKPFAFFAVTLNLYDSPLVKPVTGIDVLAFPVSALNTV